MKKIGLMVVAMCLSLSVAAFAQQDQPKAEKPASKNKAEQPKTQRTPPESRAARGDQKALNSQIAQLKQEHQTAINELEEIRKLASEEKATKTLGAVEKLIARRNQEFQQKLKKLEGQAKGGEKKQGDEAPKASGEKTPRKAGGKKNNQ